MRQYTLFLLSLWEPIMSYSLPGVGEECVGLLLGNFTTVVSFSTQRWASGTIKSPRRSANWYTV